jgi:serine/threonine kinase PknH
VDGTPFGRYRLLELVGQGGMGEVWRAFDTATERVVAVKVLPAHLANDRLFQQRFRREAHAAAGLTEPHVVPIHDFGEIDGRLYVDMRLIEGRDLQTVLRGGALPPARAVHLIEQIASALHAAHRIGLVHRDVKPSNILITEEDFAYLIDFGIARAAKDEGLTATGAMVGTWSYMAPERLTGQTGDARADVYALTCVLHQCLTAQTPYPGYSVEQQITGHLTLEPPQPSVINPAVPAAFNEVIARGMAKDPQQRYQTTGELATAARHALAEPPAVTPAQAQATLFDEPLPAPATPTRPPATPENQHASPGADATSAPRWAGVAAAARRRWVPIGIVVAVLATAAVGLGIWALSSRRSVPPTPASPNSAPSNLTPADVDLLKVMPAFGYNRSNCTHQSPTMGADAVLACDKNAAVGAPKGRFFHFPNVNVLTGAYKSVASVFHATNCPGDPPGPDGPWSVNHAEIGRQACYPDVTQQPPVQSTIIANYNPAVMEIFNWTDPGGLDALAYWWRQGSAEVQAAPGADPDSFTQGDLDLLNTLNGTEYGRANCRHADPPSPAKAVLSCDHNLAAGAPRATFIAHADRDAAMAWFSNTEKLLGTHRCGGAPGGPDDPWLHQGKPIGQYTCFADPTDNNLASLAAVDTGDTFMGVQFVADPADSPYQLPKTEATLVDWFRKRFLS